MMAAPRRLPELVTFAAVLVLAAALAVAAPLRDAGAGRSILTVRYIANAGMLVSAAGRSVMLDAPIRDGIAPYPTSPAAERERLERAEPPYDGVDAVLITHWHEDHFSPEAVAAHLSRNGRAVVISSPEVVARIRSAAPWLDRSRLHPVLPSQDSSMARRVGDLEVHVLRIRHNPARRVPEQHVGFLIVAGEIAVLHVGDADPTAGNFAVLRRLPAVDVALLPYWYLQSRSGRELVARVIRPASVVAMHLPPGEADDLRRTVAADWPSAIVAVRPGTLVLER